MFGISVDDTADHKESEDTEPVEKDQPFALRIPGRIRRKQLWITWEYREREGEDKPAKVPINERGRAVSATDPDNWLPLSDAQEQCDHTDADGVGFVFSDRNNLLGIDFDDVRDPETGAVEQWCSDLLDRLDSYTEVSPSGTGFHVIVRAGIPSGYGNKGEIEVYENDRFFTVTGKQVEGTPDTIRPRQGPLNQIAPEYLPKKTADTAGAGEQQGTTTQQQGTDTPADMKGQATGSADPENSLGIPLSVLRDEDPHLDSCLTDRVPSPWDRSEMTRNNGSVDDSVVDMKVALYLAMHHFDPGQIERLLREHRNRVRPDDKMNRTDYVSRTARKAVSWSDRDYSYPDHILEQVE